jgi:hypothetical protein
LLGLIIIDHEDDGVAFVYRRSDGSIVDPSVSLVSLVRKTLRLGPEWSVTIMQIGCGCTDPGCGETETQIMLTPRVGRSIRLRIAKPMRSVTAEDVEGTQKEGRASPTSGDAQ